MQSATTKMVSVTVNTDGSVSPDPAYAKPGDRIQWTGATAQVDFGGSDPFNPSQGVLHSNGAASNPVKPHAAQRQYNYSVTLNGQAFDPVIVIDP